MTAEEEPASKKLKTDEGVEEEKKPEVENKDAKVEDKEGDKAEKKDENKDENKDEKKDEKKEKKEKGDKDEKKDKKDKGEKGEKEKEKKNKDDKEGGKDAKDKKDKKEKDKDGAEKKEKKDGDKKDGEKKEKKEKDKDGAEKKDKKEKKEGDAGNKEKKDKKDKKDGKDKKEGKDGKEKKAGKDGKEKKDKKDKKDKKNKKGKKGLVKKKGGLSKGKAAVKNKLGKGKFGKKLLAKKKAAAAAAGPGKVLMKSEEDYEPVNKWWEREDGALSGKRGAKKWDTFEHHGLMFADAYIQHNIPIKYDGKEVKLPFECEEVATFWTACKGTTYEVKDIFIKNFWDAFTARLPEELKYINDFTKADFSAIAAWREKDRQRRLDRSKEEKEAQSKKDRDEMNFFTHALLNNVRERLGAIKLEPPSLFRGRGEHPKQGMLKKRTYPENCVVNIGHDAVVPRAYGMPGHAWKDVVHEQHVQWIAGFDDNVGEGTKGNADQKYVSFAATSGLKGQPDLLKYDRAKRLVDRVDSIRESYRKLLSSKAPVDRQKATATYFIDKLALRVGGDKDAEDEADTVGCCSLRVEHLTLEKPNTIIFDFLGKDSIRYFNKVEVTDDIYGAVDSFLVGKKPTQQVFDKVDPSTLNEYLKEFMDDLSAKVFRTFNASITLQTELDKFDVLRKDKYTQDQLLKYYNDANRAVAVLCNHQKAESKQHGEAMQKGAALRLDMEKDIKMLKKHVEHLKGEGKSNYKAPDGAKLPKDLVGCKKKIAESKMRLEKHSAALAMKEDNKCVALGTSKMNYMDPRITVGWCKKVDLAIEKVFPRTVRTKFPWAMHFKSNYSFCNVGNGNV